MSRVIHARLDGETERMLRALERHWGWTDSRVVREGIKVLSGLMCRRGTRRVLGVGQFRSGVPDLGSNKDHLKGFGR